MSTQIGDSAEEYVCEYLKSAGYTVLDRNWKTKWCEIDIVAEKAKVAHFVEVKFRRSDEYGDGFDYITPAKLRQMGFAADMWVANHSWPGEYTLSVAAVDGSTGEIDFIESLY